MKQKGFFSTSRNKNYATVFIFVYIRSFIVIIFFLNFCVFKILVKQKKTFSKRLHLIEYEKKSLTSNFLLNPHQN